MFIKGLNSWTIWTMAFGASLAVFASGYGIVSLMAKKHDHGPSSGSDHGRQTSDHGSDHGEDSTAHGNSHGNKGDDDHSQSKDPHHDPAKAPEDQEHSPPQGHESEKEPHGKAEPHKAEKKKSDPPPLGKAEDPLRQWAYTGSQGPQAWGDLDSSFVTCKTGKKQSPVDIDETIRKSDLLPIRFHYKSAPTRVKNSTRGISAEVPKNSLYVEIEGERYNLDHYIFRTPSEHRISGQLYDMEVQFVHQNSERSYAMISILIEEGKGLGALEHILKAIPDEEDDLSQTIEINPMTFLPPSKTFFFYEGSLTTPPCSEGIKWYVLSQSIDFSSKQLDTFAHYHRNNVRPVQKLMGRKVWRSTR